MKPATLFALFGMLLCVGAAQARDTLHNFSVKDVLEQEEHAARLEGIKFYFGDQAHPAVKRKLGHYKTNKKTNAFKKSDRVACEWAFMSAMVALHKRALAEGGDAVINIQSNYKSRPFKSDSEFQCGAGAIMAGVALKGDVVTFAD